MKTAANPLSCGLYVYMPTADDHEGSAARYMRHLAAVPKHEDRPNAPYKTWVEMEITAGGYEACDQVSSKNLTVV